MAQRETLPRHRADVDQILLRDAWAGEIDEVARRQRLLSRCLKAATTGTVRPPRPAAETVRHAEMMALAGAAELLEEEEGVDPKTVVDAYARALGEQPMTDEEYQEAGQDLVALYALVELDDDDTH